jgi:hypothetical protein
VIGRVIHKTCHAGHEYQNHKQRFNVKKKWLQDKISLEQQRSQVEMQEVVCHRKKEPFVLSLPFWYVTQAQNTS